jgi:hypothetical protein
MAIFSDGEFMASIYKNFAFPHIFLRHTVSTIFTSDSSPRNANIPRFLHFCEDFQFVFDSVKKRNLI